MKRLDLYDGIGSWKRRPIRAGRKRYMPSHKRWGKITVTQMPVPEGVITTSDINKPEEKKDDLPVVPERSESEQSERSEESK